MKKINFKFWQFTLCLLVFQYTIGQSLSHPRIWVKDSDKAAILAEIANETWATNLFNQYKSRVDAKKDSHKLNPATIVNALPAMPSTRSTHNTNLTLAYDASILYWLTGDEDYAQLAADILNYYTTTISQISGDVNFDLSGSDGYLIDSREEFTKPPIIYDFIHSFLSKSGTTVYNKATGTRIAFDFTKSESTFKKLADNVFSRGYTNSNHPVLEAPGALFNVLAIEDDATRNTYFNNFMNGTPKQNGLTWMMNEIKDSSVWPEATGYSVGPQRIVMELMEVVDRYKPSLNIIDNNKSILENCFFFENYRYPNTANVMSFGDAHRESLNTKDLMERVLTISDRKGYGTLKTKALEMLKALYKTTGYNPAVATQTLEWNNPYYLLWGSNVDTSTATPITYSSSINIDYAGIAMQKNINTTDRVESGLMGYTGGAHYVHSHLTGIDMELYGLGAVVGAMGGDVGANDRDLDVFRNYHRIYAGHNTVIVNGKSKGTGPGAWKADNQLMMNTTKTVAAEPASLADPISSQFSFSSQVLDDAINNAKQQRVFSVIRTSDNTGYYFDLFRSKSLGTNDFHDYVYHNVGDQVNIVDNTNTPLPLTAAPTRYPSIATTYNGSTIYFPGWHYFEDIKTSNPTAVAIKATIPMTKQGTRYTHVLMPGGQNREYTACKGPETIQAPAGYDGVKTPVFTVRQTGEAWDKPFIAIYEPSRNASGSVQSIENLYTGSKIVGAKVTSLVNGTTITDYIISNENDNEVYSSTSPQISFTGRFAIIRITPTTISQYIGKGQSLTYVGRTVSGDSAGKGFLEYSNGPQPFTVALVSPFNNQIFNEGESVSVSAVAQAGEGNTMTKVEFIANNVIINEDTTAPYALNWTPTAIGTYDIIAKAYNSANQNISSSSITIEVKAIDYTDLTGKVYRLKNVATGNYLDFSGSTVIPNTTGTGETIKWKFVRADQSTPVYYNIASNTDEKTLRFANSPTVGTMIKSSASAPTTNVDKVWTVIYNAADASYQFQTKDSAKYLYHETDNTIIHSSKTDDRSKWKVELASSPLGVGKYDLNASFVMVFPNPTDGAFQINNLPLSVSTIKIGIYNVSSQLIENKVYSVFNGTVKLDISDKAKGVYFIKGDSATPFSVKIIKK